MTQLVTEWELLLHDSQPRESALARNFKQTGLAAVQNGIIQQANHIHRETFAMEGVAHLELCIFGFQYNKISVAQMLNETLAIRIPSQFYPK